MLDEEKLTRTIQRIVDHLVRRDYRGIEVWTGGQRLNATEIAQAVDEYGREIVPLPLSSKPRSVVELEGSNPDRWSVYVDLWTKEEGRSDLTLELTLTNSNRDVYDVQIDNIHVL